MRSVEGWGYTIGGDNGTELKINQYTGTLVVACYIPQCNTNPYVELDIDSNSSLQLQIFAKIHIVLFHLGICRFNKDKDYSHLNNSGATRLYKNVLPLMD